ncbi:O-antigen ligase family protein [Flavisolibacter ginsengisoli]|jgi:O-antigen ligase|uniref:O-antigen ligase like membrane protein n=1 Tax=Flavisolibacter ginsengisoli DSM 18119 TaxID=1121884 RepID=A0A1M5B9V6_9BACT|nr:O-antigen ligase family protein [Flavisolibacter ginsengisoli]SHF39294.1 O-antigen ligase like membrane protein [Flavisolibacter ginsengisoli DSM 18119]
MNTFFLLLEVFLYAFAIYIFVIKKELGIVYLPVLFFIDTVITTHIISTFVYYGIISILILQFIRKNIDFFKNNMFAFYLLVYFFILMTKSENLQMIRQDLFNVMWLFITISLIPSIYRKYSREIIFIELSQSAFIILIIFILNVVLSSLFHYNAYSMYGITSGILYGNLYATDFNILAIAIFIVFLNGLKANNLLYLIAAIIALSFIGLSVRRSVISLSVLGVVIAMLILLSQNAKKALAFGGLAILLGAFVLLKTGFVSTFNERYELRNLDERRLDDEKRIFEYNLLYEDMFIYKRYSPWFGFGLFNSAGNYGNGKFYDRSLHGDLTSIAHSSGILGVVLYLLMILNVFYSSLKSAETKADRLIILFGLITFVAYTLTGRYTQIGCMLLLFLAVKLPLTKEEFNHAEVEDTGKTLAFTG